MRLAAFVGAGLAVLSATLAVAALFVPWHAVDTSGFHSDAGLWGISFAAGGGSESFSWEEVADSGEDISKIKAGQAFAIIATVAAFLGAGASGAIVWSGWTRWIAGGLATLAFASAILALVLFPAGVEGLMGADFFDAYDPSHGVKLAISATVFLGMAAAIIMAGPWLGRLVVGAAPEEPA